MVAARLECDIGSRTDRIGRRFKRLEGIDFGVRSTKSVMVSFANDMAISNEDTANHRVWFDVASRQCSEFERPLHERFVLVG